MVAGEVVGLGSAAESVASVTISTDVMNLIDARVAAMPCRAPPDVIDVGAQRVGTRITGEDEFGVAGGELTARGGRPGLEQTPGCAGETAPPSAHQGR